jgi:hypothetical protein
MCSSCPDLGANDSFPQAVSLGVGKNFSMLIAGLLNSETGIWFPTKGSLLAATGELAGSYNWTALVWQVFDAMVLKSPF